MSVPDGVSEKKIFIGHDIYFIAAVVDNFCFIVLSLKVF